MGLLALVAVLASWTTGVARLVVPKLDAELHRLAQWHPPTSVRFVDARGNVFDEVGPERRAWLPIEDVPPHLVNAVLAAEDVRFDHHPGVDPIGVARAAWVNLQAGAVKEGGSTISQQLVKLRLTGSERTWSRKVHEAALALRLDHQYSKDDLLELYLNEVFLGEGNYGFEAAALDYFGVSARQVDPGQAALLAGLIRAPSRTSPRTDPLAARTARDRVLDRMVAAELLSTDEATRWKRVPVSPRPREPRERQVGDAYRTAMRRALTEVLGDDFPSQAGLTVHTHFEPAVQAAAEAAVVDAATAVEDRRGGRSPDQRLTTGAEWSRFEAAAEGLTHASDGTLVAPASGACFPAAVRPDRALQVGPFTVAMHRTEWGRKVAPGEAGRSSRSLRRAAPTGTVLPVCVGPDGQAVWTPEPWVEGAAVVVDNRTHGIVALVGGRSVALEGFVRATQARRQPGSSFKPVVYAAALNTGMTQFSTVLDGPLEIRGTERVWRPQNYSGSFAGVVRLRDALARSLNTAAVRLAQRTGAPAIAELGAQMGVHTPLRPDLSIALGASEVTPLDQARVVHTLVSGGLRHDLRFWDHIDALDRRTWQPGDPVQVAPGDVRTLPGGPPHRAVDGHVAAQVVSMMHRVVRIGTAKEALSEKGPRIAKTGTSSDFVDAWLIGATPRHTVVVWLGSDDRTPLGQGETGGKAALPAWVAILEAIDEDGGQFIVPADAVWVPDGQSYTPLPRTRATARRLGQRTRVLPAFPGADRAIPDG